jgi:hypothetical protein
MSSISLSNTLALLTCYFFDDSSIFSRPSILRFISSFSESNLIYYFDLLDLSWYLSYDYDYAIYIVSLATCEIFLSLLVFAYNFYASLELRDLASS